jgi:hypothetical protein
VPGHALTRAEKARAQHVVGTPARDGTEHGLEVGGRILPVAVEVHGGGIALVTRASEPGPQPGAQPAAGLVGDHASAVLAGHVRCGVARAVVHHQQVDRQAAGLPRDLGEHRGYRRLLVVSGDDRRAAPFELRRVDMLVERRHERTTACRVRRLDPEQPGDRHRQLAHRARLAAGRSGHRAVAPNDKGHGALAPVEVAVAADAAALPVVGHQDDRRAVELAAFLQEGEKVADAPIGVCQLLEILGIAHTAYMTELVRGEQLHHEQIGVLLIDDPPGLGRQRVVDAGCGLDGGDGANDVVAEGIEQMGDPDEPAAPILALQHVEDRLTAHAQSRHEVRAHPVLVRRRAREHGGEADDRPRRVGGLDGEVLGPLAREPVDHGRVGLPQALAVGPVHDDHVDAPGQGQAASALRALGVAGQTPRGEAPPGHEAEHGTHRRREPYARH